MTEQPPTDEPTRDRIEPVDLQLEMQRSYLDYAMSVIVGRALPDVRDGLKPVHRRVLYAMYDGGYRPDRGFSKCSRVACGCSSSHWTPAATSRRLCGGMLVAMPTAMPVAPLIIRFGMRAGSTTGSVRVPS